MKHVRLFMLISLIMELLFSGEKWVGGQPFHQHYGTAEAQDKPARTAV
jgi:hypothetical protein